MLSTNVNKKSFNLLKQTATWLVDERFANVTNRKFNRSYTKTTLYFLIIVQLLQINGLIDLKENLQICFSS
jgi:hypothetical protein